MLNMLKKEVEVNTQELLIEDISNRIFARMCQVIDSNGGEFGIRYATYESARKKHEKNKYDDIPETLHGRLNKLNIIEDITGQKVTTVPELLKGRINPAKCKGIEILFEDDKINKRFVVTKKSIKNSEV